MTDAEDNPVDPRLARPRVADKELVLRALHEPFWDAEKQRATPSAFGNGNCFSLSRPAVLPEAAIVERWRADLERPDRRLEALAEARVADILACSPPEDAQSLRLNVFADPTDQNPAHAELVGSDQAGTRLRKITRGVGSQILKQCRFRTL
ncbi:hypothetical protein F2Q65_14070 [Thiohalocapsa marina]|uniref:Uncharacterized protein n=1 Tax=Thiohalocapsa marina TaxID=424902 RepID=A0A5M8FRK3_9GAMM|nr:hypothetical protein [Thiohalocapsa marina]KAA6183932.1 hypothetical protein F2Q65_14070 [Thiohalocapsa marina]